MGLAVGLLGSLTARRDGVQVVGPVGRQRTVLAMLLLDPRGEVTRARLRAELWGDTPPPSAAANLRTYVSGLRRWFTASAAPSDRVRLVSTGSGWEVESAGVELDARLFERHLRSGRQAVLRQDFPAAQRYLADAVRLCRGEPLQDVPQGPVLTARAAVLGSQCLAAVEEYSDVLLRLGEHARARELLSEFIGENASRERGWSQLMLACYRGGDAAAALRAYHAARAALQDLIAMEPGRELAELHRSILRRDPSLDWPSLAGDRPHASRSVLAGR